MDNGGRSGVGVDEDEEVGDLEIWVLMMAVDSSKAEKA